MNQIIKTRIENGVLLLPGLIRESWQDKEVLIFPEKDRLIVQPLEAGWDDYEEKMSRGAGKISSQIIDEATSWAKNDYK